MEKDNSIQKLIERLKLFINFQLIEIVDYWEADLCAIGLKKENKIVYLSTLNYTENEKLICDFDLEIIEENDNEKFEVVKVGRNQEENELINEIKLFFEV